MPIPRVLWVLLALVATILVAAPAQAVLVKSGATTLFSDNFEARSLGALPTSIGLNPGNWTAANIGTGSATVTDAAVPGPTQGDQYLTLSTTTQYNAWGANFTAGTGTTSGTVVTATFEMFIPTGFVGFSTEIFMSTIYTYLEGYQLAPVGLIVGLTPGNLNVYTLSSDGNSAILTDVDFIAGQWQLWEIEYTYNSGATPDTYTVTIDGVSSSPITQRNGVAGQSPGLHPVMNYLNFTPYSNGSVFYLDAEPEPVAEPGAVPEPMSAGLLAVGAVALAIRPRRSCR